MSDKPGLTPAFKIPSVPIYWSALTIFLIVVATFAFQKADKNQRETLNFLVLASAVGAGSLSAYYVWSGLKTSVEQRNEIIREEKVSRAMSYSVRWNAASNAGIRKKWTALLNELEAQPPLSPADLFKVMDKRTTISSVLNFCEEMGYSAKTKAVDMETLKQMFGTLLLRYHRATGPYIEFRRRGSTGADPKAWVHFEWLCDQWK